MNVLNFKNVPLTVFPAFLKSISFSAPERLPPRKTELAHFRVENGANISLEIWGSRVEERSNFRLLEYFVHQKRTLRKWTGVDAFVFLIQEKGIDRILPPNLRKHRTD